MQIIPPEIQNAMSVNSEKVQQATALVTRCITAGAAAINRIAQMTAVEREDATARFTANTKAMDADLDRLVCSVSQMLFFLEEIADTGPKPC